MGNEVTVAKKGKVVKKVELIAIKSSHIASEGQQREDTVSVRHETHSGLIWNEKVSKVNMLDGSSAKLRFAEIKQLPKSGLFAEELASMAPDIQAVSISVDGKTDLAGIESLPLLSWLLIHDCQEMPPYTGPLDGSLNLTRLVMPYAAGATERLIVSPHLRDVEVTGGSLDLLKLLPGSVRKVWLEKVKNTVDTSVWNHLSQLEELEVNQSGKIGVAAPENGWPKQVNFTIISSLKGLVEASKIRPFRTLYLEGVRLLDTTKSIWDLQAEQATISFSTKPPKWLIEAWANRPSDWANIITVPPHKLLPGSEEQFFEDY